MSSVLGNVIKKKFINFLIATIIFTSQTFLFMCAILILDIKNEMCFCGSLAVCRFYDIKPG